MAWDTVVVTPDLAEGEFTVFFELDPKALAHIQVERKDGGSIDQMRIFIQSSVDGVLIDDVAITEIQIPASLVRGSLFVMGPHFFRAGMTKVGVSDTITVDIHVTRDGGLAT